MGAATRTSCIPNRATKVEGGMLANFVLTLTIVLFFGARRGEEGERQGVGVEVVVS